MAFQPKDLTCVHYAVLLGRLFQVSQALVQMGIYVTWKLQQAETMQIQRWFQIRTTTRLAFSNETRDIRCHGGFPFHFQAKVIMTTFPPQSHLPQSIATGSSIHLSPFYTHEYLSDQSSQSSISLIIFPFSKINNSILFSREKEVLEHFAIIQRLPTGCQRLFHALLLRRVMVLTLTLSNTLFPLQSPVNSLSLQFVIM